MTENLKLIGEIQRIHNSNCRRRGLATHESETTVADDKPADIPLIPITNISDIKTDPNLEFLPSEICEAPYSHPVTPSGLRVIEVLPRNAGFFYRNLAEIKNS